MNTEHTPGPWSISSAFGVISNDEVICRVRRIRKGQGDANARLIAAAPDLLAALKVQHECGIPEQSLLYQEKWVEGWRWTHPDGREWAVAGDWCKPMPYHPIVSAAIAKAEGKAQHSKP